MINKLFLFDFSPIVSGSEDLVICMESKEKREIVCVCYLTLEGLRD